MSEKLKPCPFCGVTPKIITVTITDDRYRFFIGCPNCECSTRICDTIDEAINAWNNRTCLCDYIEKKDDKESEQI